MPFSMMRAGFPATRQFDGTSFMTTLAAATTQLSPILIPGRIMLLRADIALLADPGVDVNARAPYRGPERQAPKLIAVLSPIWMPRG